jgi:hypothetical protein
MPELPGAPRLAGFCLELLFEFAHPGLEPEVRGAGARSGVRTKQSSLGLSVRCDIEHLTGVGRSDIYESKCPFARPELLIVAQIACSSRVPQNSEAMTLELLDR